MFFKYRPAHLSDLPECRRCLRDHFAHDAAALDDLAALWRDLICGNAACTTVIEDLNRPIGHRIVWYCITAFITQEYAEHLRADAPPIVARETLGWLNEGRSPLLDQAQIRRANSSGGVIMLTLNSGAPAQIMGSLIDMAMIGRKVADYMPWSVSGYRLNEFLIEMYSPYEHAWADGYGYLLRNDHRKHLAEDPPPWLADGRRPRLYGATRREAEAQAGRSVVEQFHYEPPRFFFTSSEQELLKCSFFGDTDEDLAEFLSVSPVTLKKRWSSIYDRVEVEMPALLSGAGEGAKRGTEKKRRLLQYLWHHKEELRPVSRPK